MCDSLGHIYRLRARDMIRDVSIKFRREGTGWMCSCAMTVMAENKQILAKFIIRAYGETKPRAESAVCSRALDAIRSIYKQNKDRLALMGGQPNMSCGGCSC